MDRITFGYLLYSRTLQKKLNNKQGTEKEHAAEGVGCCKCSGEGKRHNGLISIVTFNKQRLER
jgi:hypothetical protein